MTKFYTANLIGREEHAIGVYGPLKIEYKGSEGTADEAIVAARAQGYETLRVISVSPASKKVKS